MMKIEKLSSNSLSLGGQKGFNKAIPNFGASSPGTGASPSFGAGGGTGGLTPKDINKIVKDMLPGHIKFMNFLKNAEGEVQNIIITALGTGLIAPIFIKYNFLSKKDEDTRTYGAMRQPISAVTALAVQSIPVYFFNKQIQKAVNQGYFGEGYNRTAMPDSEYVIDQYAKIVKQKNPNLSKYDIKKKAEAMAKKDIGKIEKDAIDGILNDGKFRYSAMVGGTSTPMVMDDNTLKEYGVATLNKELKETNDAIKHRLDKTIRQTEIADFFRLRPDECTSVFNEVEKELGSTSSIKDIEKFFDNLIKKNSDSAIVDSLKQLKSRCAVGDYEDVLKTLREEVKELLAYVEEDRKMPSKEALKELITKKNARDVHEMERLKELLENLKKDFEAGKISYSDVNTKIEKFKGQVTFESLKEKYGRFIDKTAANGEKNPLRKLSPENLNSFREIYQAAEKNGTIAADQIAELEKLHTGLRSNLRVSRLETYKFGEKLLGTIKSTVQGNFKAKKTIIGVVVGAVMVVPTCLALNWVYPRIMDIAFPNLSKKKNKAKSLATVKESGVRA